MQLSHGEGIEMKRIVKYDLLRIAACFAIVLLHVSNSYWYGVDIKGRDFAIMTVYNSFTRFGVPVFFMLSGLFLLDPERSLSWGKWAKKIGKLAACFFVWSLFYAFQSVFFHGIVHGWSSVSPEMWEDAVTRLVMGHGHMWFLLDLMGFYLILPALRKICEDIRVAGYFFLLWVLVRFVIVTMVPGLWGGRILAVVTAMHLYVLTGYIGYFLCGLLFHKISIPRGWRYVLYGAGAAALLFTIGKTLADCRAGMTYDDHWFNPSNINILILSIAVFVLFKHMKVPRRAEEARWVSAMAKSTFFVYMIHPFFIEKLNLLGINVIAFPVILSIPVMTVGIFAVSMLLGWLAGKIPFIGRIITFQ